MNQRRTDLPEYGASDHYLGSAGKDYFELQGISGRVAAQWNLPFWESHVTAEDSVLDFGCGGGYLLSAIHATHKVGVEINPVARREASAIGINTYATLDEVPSGCFTRIISSHALEHVLHPLIALRALRRRLCSSGRLVLLLPLDDWRAPSHRCFEFDDRDHHLYSWTPQNLGNLLTEAGFHPISISVIVDAMPPLSIASFFGRWYGMRRLLGRIVSVLLNRRQIQAICVNPDSCE
jgi:SAM-dependent methyltransferase